MKHEDLIKHVAQLLSDYWIPMRGFAQEYDEIEFEQARVLVLALAREGWAPDAAGPYTAPAPKIHVDMTDSVTSTTANGYTYTITNTATGYTSNEAAKRVADRILTYDWKDGKF